MAKENIKTTILHIEGGIGKNIAATAAVSALKNQFPDRRIIIVSAWDEPWIGNPDVYRVFRFGSLQYFYEDYVKDHYQDTEIVRIDPYFLNDYIFQKTHLIDAYCSLLGVQRNNEMPKLFLSSREIELSRRSISVDQNQPIFIIQNSGGLNTNPPYSYPRDLPPLIAQKVVDIMNDKGFKCLHIRRQDQLALDNVEVLQGTRHIMSALHYSNARLLIDSFPQHACAALGKSAVVTWICNSPHSLGYDIHNNVIFKGETRDGYTRNSYLEELNIAGEISDYPFKEPVYFDPEYLVDLILKNANVD